MEQTTIESQLQALDQATLTGLVRQAVGSATLEIDHWLYQPLGYGNGLVTGGIYRVEGTAHDGRQEIVWALILKVIRPAGADSLDPAHSLYWKREVLAYQSGLLDTLPGGLRAPRCFAAQEQPDGSVWLWLEDMSDRYGPRWPVAQMARAAWHLGAFNGAYRAGQPLPTYPWLDQPGTIVTHRGALESFFRPAVVADPRTWRQPLIRRAFPVPIADRLLRLWADRAPFREALDRVPATLCHRDAWRRNMFAPPDSADLVLIDWAYPGRAPVGTDAGDLFAPSFGLLGVEPVEAATLDQTVFDAYLEGLHMGGWQGDPAVVRFSYAAYAALKYCCLIPWLEDTQDEARYRHLGAPVRARDGGFSSPAGRPAVSFAGSGRRSAGADQRAVAPIA